MQHILKKNLCSRFSNSKIAQIIKKTSNEIKVQQSTNYIRYEELFFKLYNRHLTQQKRVTKNIQVIQNICLFGQYPAKKICQHFLNTSKNYSQQYVVQALVRLGKAYKISQSDNLGTADYSGSRLFYTPAFENIIEQFKYGLKKQNTMEWNNIALGAQSLLQMGYVDYQVINLLIQLVQRRLNKQERPEGNRPFQIEKMGYYRKVTSDVFQNLSSSKQLTSVLAYLSQKVKSSEVKSILTQKMSSFANTMKDNQNDEFIYNQIMETVRSIQSYNTNLNKLIQAIIMVRMQYRKMVERSKTLEVQRTPQLNLQLMNLQQFLIQKKLIDFADVRNPQNIQNQNLEQAKIEQILLILINSSQMIGLAELNQFVINQTHSKKQNSRPEQVQQIGRVLNVITRLAQVGKKLKNAPDGRSLISMKWQKTLIDRTLSVNYDQQSKQNLHVQKIFRRAFMETYSMISKNMSLLMFKFIQVPLKKKVLFLDSLIRIGIYDQVINIFKSQDLTKEKFDQYSMIQLSALISVLNTVGRKIKLQSAKPEIFEALNKLIEVNNTEPVLSFQLTINTLNFIVQNYDVKCYEAKQQNQSEVQSFYNSLIQILQKQVKYFQESESYLASQNLYQGYRILSVQKPSSFKLDDNYYSRFGVDVKNKKQFSQFLYKKNPYYSLILDMCSQYKPEKQHQKIPFIPTGYSLNGVLNGVLVCNSNQTSIDGKHTDGNTNGYIARIKRQYEVDIDILAVNALIKIDYNKLSQQKQFKLIEKSEVQNIFNYMFKRDDQKLIKFTTQVTKTCEILQGKYSAERLMPVVKFLVALNQVTKLKLKENQIGLPDLYNFRRHRLFISLDFLKQDFNLIEQELQADFGNIFKNISNSKLQKNVIIGQLQAIQNVVLRSIHKKQAKTQTGLFQGKRYSIETLQDYKQTFENTGKQIIDTTFYSDKTFCSYQDWRKVIEENYTLAELKVQNCANIVKILINKFLPNANQTINVLPLIKLSQVKQELILSETSLRSKATIQKNQSVKYQPNQIQTIKQLMNYVHQLKTTKSINEVCDLILSFDFIERLMMHPLNRKINKLPRDEHAYFDALQMKNDKQYLESPHLKYILNKMEHRQTIKQLFQLRKNQRVNSKILYQNGKITRKDYYSKIDKIDNLIVGQMKKMKNKLLGDCQNNLLQPNLKMVSFENNLSQISRVLNRKRYYDRTLDRDVIYSKGDLKKSLQIKRGRAEKQLVLCFIVNKLSQNIDLSTNQSQYLKNHFNYLNKKIENKLTPEQQFSNSYNTHKISDLSNADLKKLKLHNSDLSKFEDLALIDFILEIVNLIDPKLMENIQKIAIQSYYTQKYNTPKQIFLSSSNKQFSILASQEEKAMINQHSKLKQQDVDLIIQMTKVLKSQSQTGALRYANLYQDFVQNIKMLNENKGRIELITQYAQYKQGQFYEDYDPKLVRQMKQKEASKLWGRIVSTSYQQCSQQKLKDISKRLCERLPQMTNKAPPFFGLFIVKLLSHPKIDMLSKQNIISSIQTFKVPLSLDSEDIIELGRMKEAPLQSIQIMQKIKKISNKNFMSSVNKKINMIL